MCSVYVTFLTNFTPEVEERTFSAVFQIPSVCCIKRYPCTICVSKLSVICGNIFCCRRTEFTSTRHFLVTCHHLFQGRVSCGSLHGLSIITERGEKAFTQARRALEPHTLPLTSHKAHWLSTRLPPRYFAFLLVF